jgi:hypothetical protein
MILLDLATQTRQKQTKLAIGIFARCPAHQGASERSPSQMVVEVDAQSLPTHHCVTLRERLAEAEQHQRPVRERLAALKASPLKEKDLAHKRRRSGGGRIGWWPHTRNGRRIAGYRKRLLRTDPLKAMVVGAFVRGLSVRDVESLCEEAGLKRTSKSTAARICLLPRAKAKVTFA